MKNKMIWMVVVVIIAITLNSCKEDGNNVGVTQFSLYLTDAPAAYDAIYIDIQSVEVHTDAEGWVMYELIEPGIYNLLEYASGIDTLLITEELPSGNLSQIRLVLGDNNSIVVDGIVHALETPSAQQSGLKINVNETLQPGVAYAMWLDFDAEKSIVEQGNGDFLLKPVIRAYTEGVTGAISGSINPVDGAYYVYAVNGTDTAGTYITDAGTFLIAGLDAASYEVGFTANPGYLDTNISDVSVIIGSVTDIGTITIPFD